MDLFGEAVFYGFTPSRFRRPGLDYPPPPGRGPSAATRAVAVLLGSFVVPGILIAIGGVKLMTRTNDLLAPVIGMVGVVVLFVGLGIVLHALFAATSLWRRKGGSWGMAMVYGGILAPVGLMTLAMSGGVTVVVLAGGWLLAVGSVVILLLFRPSCRADFPAPVRTPAPPG